MKNRTKKLFYKFLSLRNIVPILIIILAFILTFIPAPFGLKRDQIILVLLAFILIDSLIERLDLLTKINDNSEKLIELAEHNTKDFLKFRKDFGLPEDLISHAREQIWVNGISLDTMAQLTGDLKKQLDAGLKLRFLALNPEKNVCKETSQYFRIEDSNVLEEKLKINLYQLYKGLVFQKSNQVEIKVTDNRPALGYFIIDPQQDNGYMTLEPYICQMPRNERPIFSLSKINDTKWFQIYVNDFERLWKNAKTWKPL